MSSLPLGYSVFEPFENSNNNNNNSNSSRRPNNRNNKTRKNAPPSSSSRVESMIAKIHENKDDEDKLDDFNPPPMAKSSGVERMREREEAKNMENDDHVTQEGFNEMSGNQWSQEYYQQYIPMYTNASNSNNSNNSELLEKLNYMIHLLEEERDVKQGNVTEEVVLYCFLGVFVIFVVDSFAKVGKYVR